MNGNSSVKCGDLMDNGERIVGNARHGGRSHAAVVERRFDGGLRLGGVFGFMMQPMLLTDAGGGSSGAALTVAMYIYNTASSGVQAKYDAAITTGILFSLMFGPIVFIIKAILDKFTPKVEF